MAVKHCECCGAIIPPKILFHSELRQSIYDFLVKHRGHRVPSKDLISTVYNNRDDGGPLTAAKSISVTIHYMNTTLAEHGLRIKGIGGWWGGYELQELK